ncbi:MAG TPA: ParB/RepB/Spo0J family partition protein [Chloroflexota bacterium]|nr:ParB/RepB/Spo0J family partition protein [Chloroflexota bacterium]
MASRRTATAVAQMTETWQKIVRNRPGVEDLLEAKRLPIASIDPNPNQPRRSPLQDVEALAASIVEYGLLQPIVVSPGFGGRYTCLAGHRRLAAFKYLFEHHAEPARWMSIPAIERDDHSDEWLVLALLENLSRSDLSEGEIITGLRVLHDLRGWNQAEIARRLGVTRAWVTHYFRVASDGDVSAYVQAGALAVTKAYEIVKATSPEHKQAALSLALQGAPRSTVRRVAQRGGADRGPERGAGGEAPAHGAVEAEKGPPAFGQAPHQRPSYQAHDSRQQPGNGVVDDPTVLSGLTGGPASASGQAGVRDWAELADELEVTLDLQQTDLARLIRACLETGSTVVRAGDFLRLVRADQRTVESIIRARQLELRRR